MKKRANDYNVIFNSPSHTDRGLMPLGNGETGVSIWATAEAVQCYLSRSDSLTECDRNVKLGMLTVKFEPNILSFSDFRQELILEEGIVVFEMKEKDKTAKITAFVETGRDVFRLQAGSNFDLQVSCEYGNWRIRENDSVMEGGNLSARSGIKESADKQLNIQGGKVVYHHNKESIVPYLAKLEGLQGEIPFINDNLTNRVFGAVCRIFPSVAPNEGIMVSRGNQTEISVFTFSDIASNAEEYVQKQLLLSETGKDFLKAKSETAKFWKDYFERSYIYVENDKPSEILVAPIYKSYLFENTQVNNTDSQVTRAYILSKYMQKCCMGAKYPIRFNGGYFNPGIGIPFGQLCQPESIVSKTPQPPEIGKSPDERSWGNMFLWQNERLPYQPLFMQNDLEPVKKFLKYYCSFDKINRVKAKKYYDAEGEYNTEIMTSFGLSPDYIYGVERGDLPQGYCKNRHGGAVDISPGLEQCYMLLTYCEYADDLLFFEETALPYILGLFEYIRTRFKDREKGKIVLYPLNSVETYWATKNPVTVIAGIKAILKELKKFNLSDEKKKYFLEYEKIVPDYTYGEADGKKILEPAQEYKTERHNVEIPQLYTIFPFENQMEEISYPVAKDTYQVMLKVSGNDCGMIQGVHSQTPSFSGWHYEGVVASRLGLTDEAKKILEYNCSFKHINARFPAMWGPAYDSLPDTDHGANIQIQLQEMILQKKGKKVYLLPAFPKEWNCSFRLWLDSNSYVECEYSQGKIKNLYCNSSDYELIV